MQPHALERSDTKRKHWDVAMKTRHEIKHRSRNHHRHIRPRHQACARPLQRRCKGNCRCPQPAPSRPDMADLTRYPLVSTIARRQLRRCCGHDHLGRRHDQPGFITAGCARTAPIPPPAIPIPGSGLVSPLDIPADIRPQERGPSNHRSHWLSGWDLENSRSAASMRDGCAPIAIPGTASSPTRPAITPA